MSLICSPSTTQAVTPVVAGPRDAIIYHNSTSFLTTREHYAMGEFRFRGQYTRACAPCFNAPANKLANYTSADCPALATPKTDNWVAAFGVANPGDSVAQIKTSPYLRIGQPKGIGVALIPAGEGVHDFTQTTSYDWVSDNNLAGTKCLVISTQGQWSGRIAIITGNNATELSLNSYENIAAGDFLLPAPPGFENFVYLGSAYFEAAPAPNSDQVALRNIYDTGVSAHAYMITIKQPDLSNGQFSSAQQVSYAGYVCPLATGLILYTNCDFSTTMTGNYADYIDGDSSGHTIFTSYFTKTSTQTETFVSPFATISSLHYQQFYYKNAGNLASVRSGGKIYVRGWIEP